MESTFKVLFYKILCREISTLQTIPLYTFIKNHAVVFRIL